MVDALPGGGISRRTRAVHHLHGPERISLAAAHLKAAVSDRTFDEQPRRLDGERLQEVHGMQSRCRCSSRHFKVAGAREDDVALHNMVGNESMKRACNR